MAFEDVLVHRAVPVSRTSDGEWVEGERMLAEREGEWFACVLFLPQGSEESSGRGRQVRQPTFLYGLLDSAGLSVALQGEDVVRVYAPELYGAEGGDDDVWVRWQVVGRPQPFGRPGDAPLGFQATLRRVED